MTALPFTSSNSVAAPADRKLVWRLFPLVLAFGYAWTLASLPIDVFIDRANYITYAKYSDIIIARYQTDGLLYFLANEPLWLLLNIVLYKFIFHYEDVIRVIIFCPAFVVAWQMLKQNPRHFYWIIIFLLLPQVVKNHIVHLRQGVAISVFMFAYFMKPSSLRYLLLAAAPAIHSSFLIISAIGLAVWGSQQLRISPQLRLIGIMLFLAVLSASVGLVAGSVGARQAFVYAFVELDISGVGFLFWGVMFALLMSAGFEFATKNLFAVSVLAFYLVAYFVSPLAARIFESGLFLVFLAGIDLPGLRKYIFIASFTAFSVGQYAWRYDLPWLGWSVV